MVRTVNSGTLSKSRGYVMSATVQPGIAATDQRIRWGRIVLGAVLIEAALIAGTWPMLTLMDNPLVTGTQGAADDFTNFFATVAVVCFVAGALAGWWVARRLSSRFVLHGALAGIVATTIYLALVSIPPNTIAPLNFNDLVGSWNLMYEDGQTGTFTFSKNADGTPKVVVSTMAGGESVAIHVVVGTLEYPDQRRTWNEVERTQTNDRGVPAAPHKADVTTKPAEPPSRNHFLP
jgi:hypothetical protein